MLKSPQKSSAKTVKSIKASRGRLADGQPNPVDVHARLACELINEIKQSCRYGQTEEEAAGRKRERGQGAAKGAEKVCRGS